MESEEGGEEGKNPRVEYSGYTEPAIFKKVNNFRLILEGSASTEAQISRINVNFLKNFNSLRGTGYPSLILFELRRIFFSPQYLEQVRGMTTENINVFRPRVTKDHTFGSHRT